MTDRIEPQPDDRPPPAQADPTRAVAFDDDALLDHHIEETLRAFSDLGFLRLRGPAENRV
jgi:hypothetical protein